MSLWILVSAFIIGGLVMLIGQAYWFGGAIMALGLSFLLRRSKS